MRQIELIGCTAAGKSTLAVDLFEAARRNGFELINGDRVVLGRLGCEAVASRLLQPALIHGATLGVCLGHGRRYAEFVSVAYQVLRSAGIPRRRRWSQLRKVLKQLGRYELIRRTASQHRWALVDEGTLQSAHNLFVHVGYQLDDLQLRRFAECVPLPEVAVYVRPSEEVLIERTLRRGHPRIARPTFRSVTSFVRQALNVFDQLICHERIAERTAVIEQGATVRTPASSVAPWTHRVVDLVSSVILERGTSPLHSTPQETAHRANVMI